MFPGLFSLVDEFALSVSVGILDVVLFGSQCYCNWLVLWLLAYDEVLVNPTLKASCIACRLLSSCSGIPRMNRAVLCYMHVDIL